MSHLAVPNGRRRGLSVNSISNAQKKAMNNALDNLQDDLTHVESQWNRILTAKSNPLELALAFLDDTSVGLGHRYENFRQLKTRIGYDLKEAVNEHFQVLNTTVASYGIAVESITNAQDNISQLKRQLEDVNQNITKKKGMLKELNEDAMIQSEMVEILSSIESLLHLPEKIEELIRNFEYKEAQRLLARGFLIANTHNLWSLSSLQILKQQLELQEHVLFNTLIEEIHSIIYSKTGLQNTNEDMLTDVGLTLEGFTSLENYIYNVVNVDVIKQSKIMGNRLTEFLKFLKTAGYKVPGNMEKADGFERLFSLLSIVNDINKLPNALSILTNRAKEEFHNIILKCTEEVRMNHPSLFKIAGNVKVSSDFGISAKDAVSVVIRRCFFRIFVKLLIAAQGHRAVFETVRVLLPTTTASTIYRFDLVWPKLLEEIESFVSRYLKNPAITANSGAKYRSTAAPVAPKKVSSPLFSLQSNIQDSSTAIDHTNELKTLLKDIFPGIEISTSAQLESIYVEEETFEQEDSLIPPSVFNMKVLLEPYLIFCQSASNLIPPELTDRSIPSIKFFVDYMEKTIFPKIEVTFAHLFVTKIESVNPYSLELEGNKYICKSATDFRSLLYKLMYVMNTTHIFRRRICNLLLELLEKFLNYNSNLFSTIFGTALVNIRKRIITTWLEDQNIMNLERKALNGDDSVDSTEAKALMDHCPNFFQKEKGLQKEDILNTMTVDAVSHFLSTIFWILSWLPDLKKLVKSKLESDEAFDAEGLRNTWSFFEPTDLTNMDKLATPKLSMDLETAKKFDGIVAAFVSLKNKLLTSIRFDIRARCIYHIGGLFQNTEVWDSDVESVELDEYISFLLRDLNMLENKYKQQFSQEILESVFIGVDKVNNLAFQRGMHSIHIINKNGIKKVLKNISVLQHSCRNLLSDPMKIDMSDALNLYSLCGSDESTLFEQIDSGHLAFCSHKDLKTILKLQFSEELKKQLKRNSANPKRINSMPLNSKRYHEALMRLEKLHQSTK